MKAMKTLFFIFSLFTVAVSHAQFDTVVASQRALIFADSLLNAFRYNNSDEYASLSYPGVIKYYGGIKGFEDYVQRAREMNTGITQEAKEKTEIIQILNHVRECQCVVRKTRETLIDGKKAFIISYMVGQSKDEGQTWRYFDVAFNSVENVIYIMPDIFDALAIPQRQVIFGKEQMAKN